MPFRPLILGTRGSTLALKQAEIVMNALKLVEPSIVIETRIIQTHGDVNLQPIPLDTIGKGWFTQEIERALLENDIDLAVHSLKDMADDMPAGLVIGGYLPREDARDVLITKQGEPMEQLRTGAVIGTDSARRQVQMTALLPGVEMKSLRGNVLTRLEKLSSGEYDAIILAAAGLKRLGLENRITRYFEPHEIVPAPGQGILAVQIRQDDAALQSLLTRINDEDATLTAQIERAFSRTVGGGCKAPTGAYATIEDDICILTGMIVGSTGEILHETMQLPRSQSAELGPALAKTLLARRT